MKTYKFILVNNFFRLEKGQDVTKEEIEEIRNKWNRGEIEIKSKIFGEKREFMTWSIE
jgi:hypothetical protein